MSASLPVPSASMRTALRNMAWVLGDKALAMALGLLIVGLIARSLGPVGSGHFAYAAALLQVGLGLSLVCSGSALLPRFCRINAALPGAMANVFVVRMLVSVVAALAMLAWCWLAIEDPQRRLVSMILLLAVPLMEPFHVIALYWLSRNHNRPNIIARGLGLLLRTAIVAIGLHLGAPLWLIAAAWVLEAGLNAAIQSAQLHLAMPAQRFARYVRESRARAYFGFGVRFVLSLWLQSLFIRLDRLLLAERMDSEAFGVYAVAMQLTEVWIQVAYLIGISMATAFLYRRIREGRFALAFFGTAAAMTGVGLAGLAGAWLFGPWLLRVVFGPRFDGSLPFLLAGMAVAVLLFANQIVQLTLTTLDRPRLLVLSWATAVLVAAPLIWFGYPVWGAFSGPIGLAAGVVSGWLVQLARASIVHDALRGRTAALLLPFAYFFHSRVPQTKQKVGWLLNYVVPVLALSAAAHGGLHGIAPALLTMVAVYAAYECGYLVNDTVSIERERAPTLRLGDADRAWMRARLAWAFAARALVGAGCVALLFWLGRPNAGVVLLGWLAIWPAFALYNHWRGRVTIALFLVLVGLRYALPIIAAAPLAALGGTQMLALLLLYPLPNTYEAAWKARYRLPVLKRLFGDEHRFRLAWYLVLCVGAAGFALLAPSMSRVVFALACAYMLGLRIFAWQVARRAAA